MSIEKGNFNTEIVIEIHRLTSGIAGQYVQLFSTPRSAKLTWSYPFVIFISSQSLNTINF